MARRFPYLICLLASTCAWALASKKPELPSFSSDIAEAHEIKPFEDTFPLTGVEQGMNQLHLTLTVSPTGYVTDAKADGEPKDLAYWPQIEDKVWRWRFRPFLIDGKAVTAQVEEYANLVPPERWPRHHVIPPVVHPTSKVVIRLERTGCLGSCPSYQVTISTEGILFDGHSFVVAEGRHYDGVDPNAVRRLARKFIKADFYSMDNSYRALVTDCSTYVLSISVDGREMRVDDYMGRWVGMPGVIRALEDDVDTLAQTQRWIEGSDGLVAALHAEGFNFKTYAAQVMLKEAARRGQTETVREFLKSGVPLKPLPAPKTGHADWGFPAQGKGWLDSASTHAATLQVLVDAGASEYDQADKDLALADAARAGNLPAARTLIAYGANPNADLQGDMVAEAGGSGMTLGSPGAGSILIYAAESGNPDMVREILSYQPDVEARNHEGKTAMFVVGEANINAPDAALVDCVRLLAQAGANVNARDNDGNTPLHEIFETDVIKELLKLGANVNARNNDGETPIFTNVDDEAIPILIAHGADLSIRNNKGQTVMQAAEENSGPERIKVLRDAIRSIRSRNQKSALGR